MKTIVFNIVVVVVVRTIVIQCDSSDKNIEVEDSQIWYHSSRGEDSQSCGSSPKRACRTLLWLLNNCHNGSLAGLQSYDSLKIVTDTDIQVNGSLLDEHGWIQSSDISFASEAKNETVTASLYLVYVALFQCSWTLDNMNLVVTKSNLSSTSFTLDSANNEGTVLVENSTVGTISTGPGFTVSIIGSHIDGSIRPQGTLVKVESSNVSLINSTFSNNNGLNQTIIIDGVSGSVVSIADCTFRNNTGSGSLIHVQNDTTVHISNSRFFSNVIIEEVSTLLNVLRNSSATVSDSKFEENFAPVGGIMRLIESAASVTSSLFLNNMAFQAGVYYMRRSMLNSSFSVYEGNTASSNLARRKYELPTSCILKCIADCEILGPCVDRRAAAGVIAAKDQSQITTINDTYVENFAAVVCSVMMLERVTLRMVNSSVLDTLSVGGGSIYGSECNVTIVTSTFAGNTGFGILLLDKSEMLHLMQCNFTENSVTFHILSVSGGNVFVHQSIFSENINKHPGATLISAENSSIVVAESYFNRNTNGITCGGGNLTVERNVFEDTENVIIGTQDSNITMVQSSFTGNSDIIAKFKHIFFTSTVSITECVFSNLTTKSIIVFSNSDVSIVNGVFEENFADQMIGMIGIGMTNGGALSVEYSTLKNNNALAFVEARRGKFKFQKLVLENNTIRHILNIRNSTGRAVGLEVSRCYSYSSSCDYLMVVDNNSRVDIQDSTFHQNLNIIKLTKRSTSSFTNCTFFRNRCSTGSCQLLFQIRDGSKIRFHFCQFKNNGNPKKECTMLNSETGEIVIEQSEFMQNMVDTTIACYESAIEVRNSKFVLKGTSQVIHFFFSVSHVFTKNNTFVSSLQTEQAIFKSVKSSFVFQSSLLNIALTSTFYGYGSAIMDVGGGELIIDQSKVMTNLTETTTFDSDTGQLIFLNAVLYLSNVSIKTAFTTFAGVLLEFKRRSDITFGVSSSDFFTWKTSFVSSSEYVNSTDNPDFLQDATSHKFITGQQNAKHQDTIFASAHPTACSKSCLCHYDVWNKVNIMNCSTGHRSIIPIIEPKTDWLVVSNGNLNNLCYDDGFDKITSLVLKGNNITSMCDTFPENLDKIGLSHIDLSENALTRIPKSFKKLKHVKTLLLSENHFICDCTMLWMVDWLANFTTASGKKIVEDYANVFCHSGQMIGKPIYLLDSGKMGCYPDEIAAWKIAVIALVGIALVVTVIVATIIIKRSKEARWLIYKNFNKFIQVEEQEDIAGCQFDAFVSYSNHDIELMRGIMMVENSLSPYLETQHRFMLCLHNRNFLGGITIVSNIANAIETSRRAIMILTKNFIHAPWCMEEFHLSHHKVINGKPNYLIPVLMEELEIDQLPRDLQTYLRTHTYIDGREFDLETLRKRIRFSMPDVPLSQLRRRQRIKAGGLKEDDVEMEPIDDGMEVVRMLQADGSILEVLHRTRNRPNNRNSLDSSDSDDDDDDDSVTFGSDTNSAPDSLSNE